MMIMNKELNLLLVRDKELFCNRRVKNCSLFLLRDKKLKNSFFFLIDTKVIVIRTKNKENK